MDGFLGNTHLKPMIVERIFTYCMEASPVNKKACGQQEAGVLAEKGLEERNSGKELGHRRQTSLTGN